MKNKKSPINVDLAARAEAKLDIRAEVPSTSVGRLVDAFTDIIVMIRRRADLLASASLGLQVQPRLVGILGELTGNQALLLERIACNHKQSVNWPYGSFADSPRNFA
jgi:hypothetical protein